MATISSIAVSFVARTAAFTKGMASASKSMVSFAAVSGSVRDALKAHLLLMSGGGAVQGLTKFIATGEDFNSTFRKSTAIMGMLSDEMKGDMKAAAIDVAKVTNFSAAEAAKSYFFLASAGMDAAQALEAMPTVAKFAQAGNFDLALATDLVTDAQSALGMSSKDATENLEGMNRVANALVKANTLANASVQQFSESLTNKAGAALKVVGKDIEEGVAVLAAFADQGVKGAEAGTAMSIVMRDLQTKAIKVTKEFNGPERFREFGIAVFDAAGEMRNMSSIIGEVERALDGMSDSQKKATLLQLGFTDKSVGFIQTLLGTSEKIAEYESQLRKATEANQILGEISGKQLTPIEEGWAMLTATITESASAVAQNLGPQLKELFISFANFFQRNQPAIERFFSFFIDQLGKVIELMDIAINDANFFKNIGESLLTRPFQGVSGPTLRVVNPDGTSKERLAELKKVNQNLGRAQPITVTDF